jgi:hypothetical protein
MLSNFTDTKNSVGLVGCIEEVAHNAIAVYWNPLESTAKVSTDYWHFLILWNLVGDRNYIAIIIT